MIFILSESIFTDLNENLARIIALISSVKFNVFNVFVKVQHGHNFEFYS